MAKIIIALSGPLASGKEVAKKYLEKKYQAHSYKFSSVLRDILNKLYIDITRKNLQDLSFDLRNRFGGEILAKIIAKNVKHDSNNIIVIDGVRRLDDIVYLKGLPGFILVSIDANEKIRYKRMLQRNENENDNIKSFEEFINDNNREAEKEIPTVMAQAQYKIDNNGTFSRLYSQIDNIILQRND